MTVVQWFAVGLFVVGFFAMVASAEADENPTKIDHPRIFKTGVFMFVAGIVLAIFAFA